ncbi:MAG: transporter [Candidatus Saccharibacteria bacterium]|nr:transporter [Candidatus Saccharibacteria bacterium]
MASEHPAHSAQHHASKFTSRQKTIALVVGALAFVMDLLDNTIVNVAIPSIQTNLHASYSDIQWLSAGYALSFAVLLITGGRMGDVFGYKKLFLSGVFGFTIASLLSGLAWNPEILVAARLLQGATAALMVPQVMSLMQVMYTPKERAGVMGLFGALGGLSASLGPILGGFLIEWNIFGLDWRPIFLINIPVGLIAFFAGVRFLPNGKSPHPLKLDLVGTGLIIVALGLLIYPLIEGRELDWPGWLFGMMALSVPFFAIFAWWQVKKEKLDGSPLIIPALLKVKMFVKAMAANIIFEMLMLGFFFTFTLMLQIGLGYDVLKAALTNIPVAVGITAAMVGIAGVLLPRIGRYTMTLGALIMALGLWLTYLPVSMHGRDTQPLELTIGLLLVGLGMGMSMVTIFSNALKDVDTKHAGSASGTMNAIQQLGGAIGIAFIGVIFFGQLSSYAATSFDSVSPGIKTAAAKLELPVSAQDQLVSMAKTCYVDRNNQKDFSQTPDSCKQVENQPQSPVMKPLGDAIANAVLDANAKNFVSAYHAGLVYAWVLVGITFLLSFMFPRKMTYDASGH